MVGTRSPQTISTKQLELATRAERYPYEALSTLAHFIDLDRLREAYRRTRKDGASGVDGQVAAVYEADLEENLSSLLDRFKSGLYRAPPVKRVYIPKGDGKRLRPVDNCEPNEPIRVAPAAESAGYSPSLNGR